MKSFLFPRFEHATPPQSGLCALLTTQGAVAGRRAAQKFGLAGFPAQGWQVPDVHPWISGKHEGGPVIDPACRNSASSIEAVLHATTATVETFGPYPQKVQMSGYRYNFLCARVVSCDFDSSIVHQLCAGSCETIGTVAYQCSAS